MTVQLNDRQRAAVVARGGDVVVVAGAGTGKTRVLTERIVGRVVEGTDLARIAAITFTEKAAAEMKSRLAAALLATGRATAREDVESAAVSTVHAFCARLLREFAVEARVDPSFAVLDETQSDRLERAAVRGLVAELARDDPAALGALAMLPGDDPDQTLLDLYRAARQSGEPVGAFVRRVPEIASRMDLIPPLRSALQDLEAVSGAGTAVAQRRAREVLDAARALPPDDADAEVLGAALDEVARRINLNCGEPVKSALRALREAAHALLPVLSSEVLLPVREHIAVALERLLLLHSSLKGSGSALDFTDLERRAVDLLDRDEEARRAVGDRWPEVLVDEFQDTNPLQARLFDRVRRPGGLFVVGDPKQSIYGFRGADVDVFVELLEDAEAADEGTTVVRLDQSFRARPQLAGVVNHVFRHGVSEPDAATGIAGVPYAPLVSSRAFAAKPIPSVEIAWFPAERAAEGRRAEAAWIAERIVALVEGYGAPSESREILCESGEILCESGGTLTVSLRTDAPDPAVRPATYGDVAVLLRTMSDVKTLERELTARDVPYLVVKGRGFYEAREVVDLANLLACVDDPADDITLAAALRSPLCGLHDDALHSLCAARVPNGPRAVLAGVLASWLAGDCELSGVSATDAVALRGFAALLGDLRARRAREPLAALVDRALELSGLEVLVLARPNGRQRAANLRKVRELALRADREMGVSLGEFVARMRELREREVRETEAPVAGAAAGAVSLLTVHAAKGLEFPIVFVPDVGRRAAARRGKVEFHARDGVGLAIGVPGHPLAKHDPAEFALIRARNTARDRAEELRLLYVAMTRAEEHLVLTASLTSAGGARTWWDRLRDSLELDLAVRSEPVTIAAGRTADRESRHEALVLVHAPGAGAATGRPAVRSLIGQVARALATGRVPAETTDADAVREADSLIAEVDRREPPADGTLYLTTVSALVALQRCPEEFRRRHVLGIPESLEAVLLPEDDAAPDSFRPGDDDEWGVPLSARALGRAAHLALERLVPEFADDAESLVRAALLEETGGSPPDPADVARITAWVRAFEQHELGRAVRAAPRAHVRREQPVLLRSGRTIVRGQIDLLFHDGAGWVLVDYKASHFVRPSADYELQMQLYALAIGEVMGEAPRRVVVFSLPDGEAVDIPADAATFTALRRGVLAELERRSRENDYSPRDDPPCFSCGYRSSCAFSRAGDAAHQALAG